MICRLCLQETTNYLPIFEKNSLNEDNADIAAIITQHFWFEPTIDDEISTFICCSCWKIILEFHQYYERIKDANRNENLLIENIIVKAEQEEMTYNLREGETEEPLLDCLTVNIKEIKYDCTENDVLDNYTLEKNDFEHLLTNDFSKVDDSTSEQDQTDAEENMQLPNFKSDYKGANYKLKVKNKLIKSRKKRSYTKKSLDKSKDDKDIKKHSKNKTELKDKFSHMDELIAKHIKMKCQTCGNEHENFVSLCKHMRKVHNIEKCYVICCNRKYFARPRLYEHVQKHIDPESLSCKICAKSFAEKKTLQTHLLNQHQIEGEQIYQCKLCPQTFAKLHILERHEIMHGELNCVCEVCQKRFPTETLLETHFNVIHNNGILCDICAKEIRGRKAFERHRLEHEGIQQPKIQCDICFTWHRDKHGLRRHKSRHNLEGIIHKCSICEKIYPNRIALQKHQREVHTAPRFECTICPKAFKKAVHLKEHLATHTGQSLYSCPYCPKTFNATSSLHCHRKNMHPKEFEEARQARKEKALKTPNLPTLPVTTVNSNTLET